MPSVPTINSRDKPIITSTKVILSGEEVLNRPYNLEQDSCRISIEYH